MYSPTLWINGTSVGAKIIGNSLGENVLWFGPVIRLDSTPVHRAEHPGLNPGPGESFPQINNIE